MICWIVNSQGEGLHVLFNLYCWDKKTGNDATNMTDIIMDKIKQPLLDKGKLHVSKVSNAFQGIIIDPASVQIKGTTYSYKQSASFLFSSFPDRVLDESLSVQG